MVVPLLSWRPRRQKNDLAVLVEKTLGRAQTDRVAMADGSRAVSTQPFTGFQSRLSLRESCAAFAERKTTFHANSRATQGQPVNGYGA